MTWTTESEVAEAGEGPAVPWLAPPPIPLAPEALDALAAVEEEATPGRVAAEPEVEAMSVGFAAPDAPDAPEALEAAPAAPPAPAPEDGAEAEAPAGGPAARVAVDVAPPAPTVDLAGSDGGTVTGGAFTVDPRSFDGEGTAVIVIDDGWSPYYDQSNVVFDHDFSGAGDGAAGRSTLASHGSWVADVTTDVAPAVDIVHLKVFDDDGGASFADVEEALQWSVRYGELFGAVAVNMSLGVGNATGEVRTMLSDELAALAAQDIATTVAAGNAGAVYDDGVNVIAADPNAIGVSAVDRADRFTTWSQTSEALTDVAALGQDVVVDTVFGWGVEVSGTSFAAPYVAGTAARLQDAAAELLGERLDPDEVVRVMTESGRDVLGAPDDVDGYTVADADAAVDWFVEHHATFADDALIA